MSHLRPIPASLRDLTSARVALPTAGDTIATSELLDFQLAHALARDAVHAELSLPAFTQRLRTEIEGPLPDVLQLRSNAPDRATYLRRPDLGRTLHPDSAAQLIPAATDLAIILADGLSALALERHAIPLLTHLLPALLADNWQLAPITVVRNARVSLSDEIACGLGSRCSLILLGERPGLSSPDSMGAYLTWSPGPARTDADRNCLSNIRTGGLAPADAADRLRWYLRTARTLGLSGVSLTEGTLALPE